MVAGYMNRDATEFVQGAVNVLGLAVNHARQWAEKQRNFELCKVSIKVPAVNLSTGAALSTATIFPGGAAVTIKCLERAFIPFSNQADVFPVELIGRDAYVKRMGRRFDNAYSTQYDGPTSAVQEGRYHTFAVLQQAQQIFVVPNNPSAFGGSSTVDVYFDAVKWLPDYSADGDTDFFLSTCEEFMLYRTIYQLNAFLKEDQRVAISAKMLEDAWDTVIKWDLTNVAATVDDANLD